MECGLSFHVQSMYCLNLHKKMVYQVKKCRKETRTSHFTGSKKPCKQSIMQKYLQRGKLLTSNAYKKKVKTMKKLRAMLKTMNQKILTSAAWCVQESKMILTLQIGLPVKLVHSGYISHRTTLIEDADLYCHACIKLVSVFISTLLTFLLIASNIIFQMSFFGEIIIARC